MKMTIQIISYLIFLNRVGYIMGNKASNDEILKNNNEITNDNNDWQLKEKEEQHNIMFPFEKQVLNGTMFYVKGNKNTALRKHCLVCDKERFTAEEISILSNEGLTSEEFNKLDFGYAYPVVCSECRYQNEKAIEESIHNGHITNLQQSGSYACHIFKIIWVIEFGASNSPITSNKYR
jgi:hypothetical protein